MCSILSWLKHGPETNSKGKTCEEINLENSLDLDFDKVQPTLSAEEVVNIFFKFDSSTCRDEYKIYQKTDYILETLQHYEQENQDLMIDCPVLFVLQYVSITRPSAAFAKRGSPLSSITSFYTKETRIKSPSQKRNSRREKSSKNKNSPKPGKTSKWGKVRVS